MCKKEINSLVIYFLSIPIFTILNSIFGTKFYVIYCLFLCGIFLYIGLKKIDFRIILFMFFLLMFSFLSISFYDGKIYNWCGMIFLLFIYSFPWLIISSRINDWKLFFCNMKRKMNLYFLINLVLFVYCVIDQKKVMGNMELSYSILPFCLFSLYYFWTQKKIKYILFFVFSSLTIVIYGSRGTLLCIASFFFLYLMLNFRKNFRKIIFLSITLILVVMNFDSILNYSISLTSKVGIASRTLYKLKEGTILTDTGRTPIHEVSKKIISEHWVIGVGIGGDRPFINDKIYFGAKDMNSCYPHNFILEFLSDYGIFIGSILLFVLLIKIIISLKTYDYYSKMIIVLIVSMELVRLLVSSSYIRSPLFFILLGILFFKKEEYYEKNIVDSAE